MTEFHDNFCDYVCSGHAMLAVSTHEKDRGIRKIVDAAKTIDKNVFVWSIASGWKSVYSTDEDSQFTAEKDDGMTNAEVALSEIIAMPDESVYILKDFGVYLHQDTYPQFDLVISLIDEIKEVLSNGGKTIVFLGGTFKTPESLKYEIANIDIALPSKDDIRKQIDFVCEGVESGDGSKFEQDEKMIPEIISACQGMTEHQVQDRLALAIRKTKALKSGAVKIIIREKGDVVRSSGILDFMEPPDGGLDMVGGYHALKNHVNLDKPCFSDEAKEFGIEYPKGILLVGVPGCGKTLLSIAIASELGLPIVCLDVGRLMDKFIGESESNIREAIKIIESIAPCLVQVDEIEKGFGSSGDMDGGSSRRVFGTFLKWLSDKTSAVYVVATANDVTSLPPELFRKGRFDEVFGLDLPSEEERGQIFKIHLSKRDRDPDQFQVERFAKKSQGFTGSDIEQAIKLGLKIAFCSKDDLRDNHVISAIEGIVPLAKTEEDRVNKIRDWCKKHTKQANPAVSKPVNNTGRKVVTRTT